MLRCIIPTRCLVNCGGRSAASAVLLPLLPKASRAPVSLRPKSATLPPSVARRQPEQSLGPRHARAGNRRQILPNRDDDEEFPHFIMLTEIERRSLFFVKSGTGSQLERGRPAEPQSARWDSDSVVVSDRSVDARSVDKSMHLASAQKARRGGKRSAMAAR